jgi:hypothetical protein
MKFSNIVASGLLLVGLAACVTTPAHNMSADAVRALNVQRVDVALDPAARINWPSLEYELAHGRSANAAVAMPDPAGSGNPADIPPPKVEVDPAQMKAQALSRLTEKGRALLQPSLKSKLAGSRPVVARMTVHSVNLPSLGRILVTDAIIGAGASSSMMEVSVDFLDARTGAPVLSYPKTLLSTQGGYKLNMGTTGIFSHDPVERMLAGFDDQLSSWLLKT